MKRLTIAILSIGSLTFSAIWVYNSGYSLESIITLMAVTIGLITQIPKIRSKLKFNPNPKQPTTTHSVETPIQVHQPSREDIIEIMKPKMRILFVDDDKNFNVVKILRDSGWKNTKTVTDVKALDMQVIKDSLVLFIDINGVGKLLGLQYEGLDLALMLKQKYPDKKIIIYSANKVSNAFHKAWDECDFKLEKNALPYQFQNLVEEFSIQMFDKRK